MLKYLFVFLAGILICQNVEAQKLDTSIHYMWYGKVVATKDSADRYRMIISPDSSTDMKLYTVKDFYLNGRVKMVATASNNGASLLREGYCVDFFPNGHRKLISNYKSGQLSGNMIAYYPNSKLYFIKNYGDKGRLSLIECLDSTGKKLTENGSGEWLNLDTDYKKILDYGPVVDSMANGQWNDYVYYDTTQYKTVYKNNIVVSTNNFQIKPGVVIFIRYRVEIHATFAGPGTIGDFINKNLKYPVEDKKNHVEGKVHVAFIVETDGTVSNIKVIDATDEAMKEEAIRVVSLLHWRPYVREGMVLRSQVTIPVNFALANN